MLCSDARLDLLALVVRPVAKEDVRASTVCHAYGSGADTLGAAWTGVSVSSGNQGDTTKRGSFIPVSTTTLPFNLPSTSCEKGTAAILQSWVFLSLSWCGLKSNWVSYSANSQKKRHGLPDIEAQCSSEAQS